jgi:glycolate oxidase
VTPSAALTGLSGGAIPIYGGVSISMKKMNHIISIDEKNFQAVVEPGVINEEFQTLLKTKKMFYPPDPASKGSCTLGGNFALNAGGPKAVKYGVTSNYVLNLEIVLPNGEIIWTGANTLKNATGYNLTQLIIGSEGTLAVITKAVLKLLPLPTEKLLILVPFHDNVDACNAVADIMHHSIIPSALEFMEKDAVLFVLNQKYAEIPFEIDNVTRSYLLIELDGEHKDYFIKESEKIYNILEDYKCGEVLFAETDSEQERIWKVRRSIGLAVKAFSIYKEEDTVVPRAQLAKLLMGVKHIGKIYNFRSICYGHAGDGNLHVNILKDGLSDYEWSHVLKKAIKEIFQLCVDLNGTISGEHGIGLVQKDYIKIPLKKQNLCLQKQIKLVFDPNNILNPGKIFPE